MKRQSKKQQLEGASVFAALLLTVIFLVSLFSFTVKKYTDDFWNQLGISQKNGEESIRQSFLQGYLYSYGARSARNIAAGDRAAVTRDLLTYTRQYVAGDAFRKEYEKARAALKPMEPSATTPRTKEEIRKELVDNIKKSIADIEKNMAGYQPDLKKVMQDMISSQKEQITEYEKPDNQLLDLMEQGEKMRFDNDRKNFQEQMAKWEQEYPAEVNGFIKRRVQQYLDIVKTVDFSATVTENGGRRKFTNPVYEAKNNDWKKVYRAGKEVNDVARPFAAAWIREL